MASFRGILQTFSPLTSSHRELRRNVFSVPKLGRVVGGSRPGCMGLCLTDPSQRRPEDCCCFCSTQRAQPPVPCSSLRGSFHTYAQGGLQGYWGFFSIQERVNFNTRSHIMSLS